MEKYQVIEKIGQGAYGVVLKCKCTDQQFNKRKLSNNNKYTDIVAMKQCKDSDDNQIVKRTTMRQIKILKMLEHPNIVHLRQAYRKKGYVNLIFQYVRNNLLEVLEKSPDGGLEHQLIRILIYQLIKGLGYLHSQNIIHRDIKPENLLISEENQLKICDFGFARIYKKSNKQELTDYVATRWYRAPELLVGAQYNKQIDIWAVGCIMGELIDGNPMFPGENQLGQLFLIQKCLGPLATEQFEVFLKNPRYLGTKLPEITTLETIDKRYAGKFSPKGLNFLKCLLKMNPSQRLTAHELLKHTYFEGVEQEILLRRTSGVSYIRNESKLTEKQQAISIAITSNSVNEKKKLNASFPYQTTSNNEIQKSDKTDSTHIQNIFNVSKIQKINITKKKKKDNFILTKAISNNSNTSNPNTNSITNPRKSLGKTKINNKLNNNNNNNNHHQQNEKQYPSRHISLQKNKRQIQTKTQTGFYIVGGSIIPERPDQDQQTNHYLHPEGYYNNKIYNVKSPNLGHYYKKQPNLKTQQINQQQNQAAWQLSEQFPMLMMTSHKSSQNKYHHRTSHMIPPNIIITNSTFNYRQQ